MNIIEKISQNLSLKSNRITAAVKLIDEGATVPFIARYRKEVTQNLSDVELRDILEQLTYLRELEERKGVILKSIKDQDKLSPELEQQINDADNKAKLEDLYLPYKPKRRTKAQIAREAGLEPLAMALWQDDQADLELAQSYINPDKEINDAAAALEGAKQILMEIWSENAQLSEQLRAFIWQNGIVTSDVVAGQEEAGKKFSDYFSYRESIKRIPSHRALALFRGRREKILKVDLTLTEELDKEGVQKIINFFDLRKSWLLDAATWSWKVKLYTRLELDLMSQLRELAETDAIKVFASNLKDLLMASPAGAKVTMGLDPGFRTGVKATIIDPTGKLLHHTTIFPHPPSNQWDKSLQILVQLCNEYHVELISIGNGTASRETDKLATEVIKKLDNKINKIVVSEAGASVYSASKIGTEEFPDLDVSYRGAVSIARRLQDPLAELVKIDPKSIGVGQYQHDVSQVQLARSLDGVVEDCVNAVGVDVNTASPSLLARVAGLNDTIASNIVEFRNQHGAFDSRERLKKVPRLGDKTFEQAAGFLKVMNGINPLDASAVHPEAYPVVTKIVTKNNIAVKTLIGNTETLNKLNPSDYLDDQFGLPTVIDIIKELEKPGRDPRPEFKMATFKEGIDKIGDLKAGMELQGSITNVTNFGAFVDIGVHQDGLVHKSQLADRYINDPREVVRVGDIVMVTVLEVDVPRKRISLKIGKVKEAHTKNTVPKKAKPKLQNDQSVLAMALGRALKK